MEAKICLSYENPKEAEAVTKAVAPDNVKVPAGLKIKMRQQGNKVFTHITCKTRLQTFISTIDDLLESISIAENTFKIAKKRYRSQS